MFRIAHFLIPFAAFATFAAGPARAQESLNDTQITGLLAGKSALFADHSLVTYSTDGSYTYVAPNNIYYKGRYTVSGGKLCLTLEHGKNRCDQVGRDSFGPYLFTAADDHRHFTIHLTTSPLTFTTLCGVPVAYTVYPPAPSVPADVAAFSGTWIGQWDSGICGALVVESILPNGLATVIYVNGEYGLGSNIKPGAVRFQARIMDSVLSDGGRTTGFEATLKGNELSARRTGGPGAGTAKFTKR